MTLDSIHTPADLKKLSRDELPALADELRHFVLDSVSKTGGHLSSNLGTVELSIALHYVFDTPADRIVWDVGHQSYPHKILTGRREQMKTLRQFDGLAGFPRRSESEYDAFGTGHSSTSISAAMGMARAFQTLGEHQVAVAVIGDSAMTGGMAFEAMNNAGVYDDLPLVVILNDNDMSISPAVGALNRHLARLLSGNIYSATKKGIDSVLSIAPPLREFAKRLEDHAKGMVSPSTIFQEFGFNYFGPIDGHDLDALVPMLQNVRRLAIEGRGPQFLHVVTRKGQGYELAEADPVLYHGPSKFNPDEGVQKPSTPPNKTFTQVFGEWLCDMAHADPLLIGITPAMREGSGLVEFEKQFPNRYYDVGIAEQHAVTFAAGMACEGMKPVVAIYSTFLQRAYDPIVHDIALQNLPVTFCMDRAGLSPNDGATHHGLFDISYLRCVPGIVAMQPKDEDELCDMLHTSLALNGPGFIRYPRGAAVGTAIKQTPKKLEIGKAEIVKDGKEIFIWALGPMVEEAFKAANLLEKQFGILVGIVNPRFIKPIDKALLLTQAASSALLVTMEDHVVTGGFGSSVLEILQDNNCSTPVERIGWPDQFVEHGSSVSILRKAHGLSSEAIVEKISKRFSALTRK